MSQALLCSIIVCCQRCSDSNPNVSYDVTSAAFDTSGVLSLPNLCIIISCKLLLNRIAEEDNAYKLLPADKVMSPAVESEKPTIQVFVRNHICL